MNKEPKKFPLTDFISQRKEPKKIPLKPVYDKEIIGDENIETNNQEGLRKLETK